MNNHINKYPKLRVDFSRTAFDILKKSIKFKNQFSKDFLELLVCKYKWYKTDIQFE